jgi:hypothetical protein
VADLGRRVLRAAAKLAAWAIGGYLALVLIFALAMIAGRP